MGKMLVAGPPVLNDPASAIVVRASIANSTHVSIALRCNFPTLRPAQQQLVYFVAQTPENPSLSMRVLEFIWQHMCSQPAA